MRTSSLTCFPCSTSSTSPCERRDHDRFRVYPRLPDSLALLAYRPAARHHPVLFGPRLAIRPLRRLGHQHVEGHDLTSLWVLGLRRRAHQPRGVALVQTNTSEGRSAPSLIRSGKPRRGRSSSRPSPCDRDETGICDRAFLWYRGRDSRPSDGQGT